MRNVLAHYTMSESTKLAVNGSGDAAWSAALLHDGYCLCSDIAPRPIVEAANDAIRDYLARNYDFAQLLLESATPNRQISSLVRRRFPFAFAGHAARR
jgi:hypothetical protein